MLGLEDSVQRERLRKEIIEKGLSVRGTEERVQELKAGVPAKAEPGDKPATTPLKARLENLSSELSTHLSAKVLIKGSDKKGRIQLAYGSRSELDRLVQALQNVQV